MEILRPAHPFDPRTEALAAALERLPPTLGLERVQEDVRFVDAELSSFLAAASREASLHDPERAIHLARLAVAVAEGLDRGQSRSDQVADERALAWAQFANASRVSGDFAAADKAFLTAYQHLEQGSADPLLLARVQDLQASLRSDQRRFEEASELLHLAVCTYESLGQEHLEGRALVKLGTLVGHAGEPDRAVRYLRRGLALLDPHLEPRTPLVTIQNLIYFLNEIGYTVPARSLLDELRTLYRCLGDHVTLLRVRWLEGKMDLTVGRHEHAVAAFSEVRAGFLELSMAYDAALVSLDLAALHAQEGHVFRLRRLCEEMFPIFQSRQIHREAIAALILFREAVAVGNASLHLIQKVYRFLEDSRLNPKARFQPAS